MTEDLRKTEDLAREAHRGYAASYQRQKPAAILALEAERDAATARAEKEGAEAKVVCDSYAEENQRLFDRAEAAEASLAAVTAERDALRNALQRLESAASSMLIGVGVHNDRYAARSLRIEGPVVSELVDATRNAGITLKEPTNAE
jgi:hypothetical protein